jgi:hypothetical protein
MNPELVRQIREAAMSQKSVEELEAILREHDQGQFSIEGLEAARQELIDRGGRKFVFQYEEKKTNAKFANSGDSWDKAWGPAIASLFAIAAVCFGLGWVLSSFELPGYFKLMPFILTAILFFTGLARSVSRVCIKANDKYLVQFKGNKPEILVDLEKLDESCWEYQVLDPNAAIADRMATLSSNGLRVKGADAAGNDAWMLLGEYPVADMLQHVAEVKATAPCAALIRETGRYGVVGLLFRDKGVIAGEPDAEVHLAEAAADALAGWELVRDGAGRLAMIEIKNLGAQKIKFGKTELEPGDTVQKGFAAGWAREKLMLGKQTYSFVRLSLAPVVQPGQAA